MRRSAQFRFIAFVALAIAVAPLARSAGAQEAKDDNKAMDAVLAKSVFETIKLGFPLYNAGDQAGCYRVYEGALTALVPTLGYRPDLQKEIKQGLNSLAAMRTPGDRAFALRKLLDKSYNVLAHRTLWNRLGGEPAVTAVVHDLVLVAAKDPKVDFTRGGKYKPDLPKLERLVVEFVSSATGGPLKYQGRDMKTSHEGMGITEAQFNAFAADLIAVLKKYMFRTPRSTSLSALSPRLRALSSDPVRRRPPSPKKAFGIDSAENPRSRRSFTTSSYSPRPIPRSTSLAAASTSPICPSLNGWSSSSSAPQPRDR